jgi:hypothetical protein
MMDACFLVVLCVAWIPVTDMEASGAVHITTCDSSNYLHHGTLLDCSEGVVWITVPMRDRIEPGHKNRSRRIYGWP